MNKKTELIVFLRHAHRDKPIPDKDNGLSDKGRKQVEDLLKDFKKGKIPKARIFWSSPKIRCQETLEPLSEVNGAEPLTKRFICAATVILFLLPLTL
jgi:broad specificity phosphatase PhoE